MKTVEFMGMPKAGKSTQLETAETVLKHAKNYCVRNLYEGARICPLDKRDRFLYNAWSFHNTANRLMETRLGGRDYLLIDRGMYDHIAFTHALYHSGKITKEHWQAQTAYFQTFTPLEDAVLVFMIDVEEAMKRENKHHTFAGRVMNREFLDVLHDAYNHIIPTIQQEMRVVDGTKASDINSEEILAFLGLDSSRPQL